MFAAASGAHVATYGDGGGTPGIAAARTTDVSSDERHPDLDDRGARVPPRSCSAPTPDDLAAHVAARRSGRVSTRSRSRGLTAGRDVLLPRAVDHRATARVEVWPARGPTAGQLHHPRRATGRRPAHRRRARDRTARRHCQGQLDDRRAGYLGRALRPRHRLGKHAPRRPPDAAARRRAHRPRGRRPYAFRVGPTDAAGNTATVRRPPRSAARDPGLAVQTREEFRTGTWTEGLASTGSGSAR